MTANLEFHSQVTSPDGGFNIEGWAKLVQGGQPWATFFREVFQNSNDARISPQTPINFTVDLSEISNEAKLAILAPLRDKSVQATSLGLNELATADAVNMLVVADSHTLGLSGGTNPQTNREPSRFSQFFFDLGRKEGSSDSGGSFGFGRNVLFQASQVSTIVVFTRFMEEGRTKSRFMGMAAGKSVFSNGRNLTGLHWWGQISSENSISPFEGTEAEQLGQLFGLSQYLHETTGTAIGIIAPIESAGAILANIEASALLYAWPHMIASDKCGGKPSVNFSFVAESMEMIPIQPYEAKSPVMGFLEAHARVMGKGNDARLEKISLSQAPHAQLRKEFGLLPEDKVLGHVAWSKLPVGQRDRWPAIFGELGFKESSQIALLRGVGIVVDYATVTSSDVDFVTWGVFLVDQKYEQVFRKAENITHDRWEPSRLGLPKGAANPIKIAQDSISRLFAPRAADLVPQGRIAIDLQLADFIGQFVDGLEITGGSDPGTGPGPKPPPPIKQRPTLSPAGQSFLGRDEESRTATGKFEFNIKWPDGVSSSDWSLELPLRVLAADGVEKTPPTGSSRPTVLTVLFDDKKQEVQSSHSVELRFGSEKPKRISVTVAFPTGIRIDLPAAVRKVEPIA